MNPHAQAKATTEATTVATKESTAKAKTTATPEARSAMRKESATAARTAQCPGSEALQNGAHHRLGLPSGGGWARAGLAFATSLLLAACGGGSAGTAPAPPDDPAWTQPIDYSRDESWLARPGLASPANEVPRGSGFSNLQAFAHADLFYVHPTTSLGGKPGNATIDDPQVDVISKKMVQAQATPFNAVARIFAPRYRQLTLPTYQLDLDAQQAPNNRAYADVRRAFEYYLAHDNGGRPFFLLGHSQGSNHVQRLLSEVVQGTALEKRLIAAYIPGQPLPRTVFDKDLTGIPPCRRPEQTGCAAVWGVFGEGVDETMLADWGDNPWWDAARGRWVATPGVPLVNINPVSWDVAEPVTPAARHRGGVPFGVAGTDFTRPRPQLVGARDDGRYTFVSPLLTPDLFDDGGIFGGANYHVFDISLFWLDLRENARLRLNAFLRHNGSALPLPGPTAAVTAQAWQRFRFRIDLAGTAATLQASGLPAGLELDAASGVISGIARDRGVYAVVFTATNAAGSDHGELALTVE